MRIVLYGTLALAGLVAWVTVPMLVFVQLGYSPMIGVAVSLSPSVVLLILVFGEIIVGELDKR